MRTCFLIANAALACIACSAESTTPMRNNSPQTQQCIAGASTSCVCSSGTGTQTCSAAGTYSACECEPGGLPIDVGNPDPITPVVDAGPAEPTSPMRDCSPGLYLGTYECEISLFGFPVPLAGDVSFNLSINEMTIDQECEPGIEFCSDLVISENGGTLFGLAGFIGFETMLEGALDCTTGEFRANGVDGRWGNAVSTDPNDPNALWTVEEPAMGMFDGTLMGTHATAGSTETIAGDWDLRERAMGITCAGPFTVALQP
jgi:hypothetical protein